ncbi:MAG: pentapeptide repeat-containing protein [Chloroflexota bacterium]
MQGLRALLNRVGQRLVNYFPWIVLEITIIVALALVLNWLRVVDGSGLGPFGDQTQVEPVRARSLWDWLDLLIVPAFLAGAALWVNNQIRQREHAMERRRHREDTLRQADRYREETLQKYMDEMSDLVLTYGRNPSEALENIKAVATLRTVAALRRLDRPRRKELFSFLRHIDWLRGDMSIFEDAEMQGVDLEDANLEGAHLQGAVLERAILKRANLLDAMLQSANLAAAYLSDANLSLADLTSANLNAADLTRADLIKTRLNGAYLNEALLVKANLTGADLRGADMADADLTGALVENVQLDPTTILPDGTNWENGDLSTFTVGNVE